MINIDYSLIIVILNFVLLLIILNKILYKPINKFLSERREKIVSDMENAKNSKQKALELVKRKEEELKKTAEEIRRLKKKAKQDAEKQSTEILKSAVEHEKRLMKELDNQLILEKEKVLTQIKSELAEMISQLSEKFLSGKIDEEQDLSLINKMLTDKGDK